MLLHADPQGGDNLLGWYKKLGMSAVPREAHISRARKNDGRYFYFNEIDALLFSKSNDKYRTLVE
ncbi:hypothetical protein HPC49_42485 [Pyxidicoccus fallax]|uniref:Uncharacterized protein n=1 Tax=Pyxidicoccus fallax TaxID=394095 RepID=A0A848LP54_9BACT|nr:hypothetical protein [Pyxidicoccus fallax]NMO19471.1 hypothetical protein [Pyxidicoccus fallax]NPC84874.1 hypothetical protein [Pyxidicoccus fallax]